MDVTNTEQQQEEIDEGLLFLPRRLLNFDISSEAMDDLNML